MNLVAKVFRNGRSQAVRLPAQYRFDTAEVFVRRDPVTGDVILSRRPSDWEDLFRLADAARQESRDYLVERIDAPAQERKLF
jgi:antitoxin VapB